MKIDVALTNQQSIDAFNDLQMNDITELSITEINWDAFARRDIDLVHLIFRKIQECSHLNLLSLSGLELGMQYHPDYVLNQLLLCTNIFHTLQTLDLSDNELVCDDLDHDSFTQLIESLTALESLLLHDNYLFSVDEDAHLFTSSDSVNKFFHRLSTLRYPHTLSHISFSSEEVLHAHNHPELREAARVFQTWMNDNHIDIHEYEEDNDDDDDNSQMSLTDDSLQGLSFFSNYRDNTRDSWTIELSSEEDNTDRLSM